MDEPIWRKRPELTPELLQECQEWIARRRADLDQRKKAWEDQYPFRHPRVNEAILFDLEAREFWIEIHEWELENLFESFEEEGDDYPSQP